MEAASDKQLGRDARAERMQRAKKVLDALVVFFKRNDGRDKAFRVVQYSSLLTMWALSLTKTVRSRDVHMKAHVGATTPLNPLVAHAFVGKLGRAMSTSRKALKLVRMLEDIQAIFRGCGVLRSLNISPKIRALALLRIFSAGFEIVYYFFDHTVWVVRNGLHEPRSALGSRASSMSSIFWLLNAVLDATIETIEFDDARRQFVHDAKSKKTDGDAASNGHANHGHSAVRPRHFEKMLSLVKIWLDVLTASAETVDALDYPSKACAFVEASAGLGASVLGLRSVWRNVFNDL
ncbi:Peroxisomal membrane protein 11B [Porphyridium purpureum]|uniref:Peroxisomal membrane protein 11B n=1 Tax=Porphyridium purpureum TaxID=35688 RepID=A0A5J4Z745_PORPP|nr:Peroxisomal membrane protein 11B [Porphyridium purpureum]|eukprot:POR9830..scf295_1